MNEPKGMFFIEGEPSIVTETRRKILKEFEDLEFYEEGHTYILNGQKLNSVSTIGHRFLRYPFDEKKQAQAYAEKHGGTIDYWVQKWNEKSFKATTLGTKTHEYAESLGYILAGHPEKIKESVKNQFHKSYNYLAPISPKEEAAYSFIHNLPKSMHLVLNEAMVYSGKNPQKEKNLQEVICGTFDMLYYYDGGEDKSKSGFVLMDYKTNDSLYSDFNRDHDIKLLPPFDNFIEEELSLYAIQLSLYALMLEDISVPVIGRRLIWLKAENDYSVIPLKDLSETLRKVL